MSRIILASASPRRKELLEQVGLEFEICPAKGEEIITKTIPSEVVMELSKQKAEEVASLVLSFGEQNPEIVTPQDILVIGADTIVAYDGQILGKPKDEEDAKKMMRMLQGNTHSVYTGVTFVFIDKSGRTGEKVFFEQSDVTMWPISEKDICAYVEAEEISFSGNWRDKAGGYGIQEPFGLKYIKGISGDYNNVVGLPVSRIYQELLSLGIDWYLW